MTPEVGMYILSVLVLVALGLGSWALKSVVDLRIQLGQQKSIADERKAEIDRRFNEKDTSLERVVRSFEQSISRIETEVVAVHKRLDKFYEIMGQQQKGQSQ
jgi:uncharacterized protein HemX